MKQGIRTVVYDQQLRLEAYRFQGIAQPFPSHFHEHYVLGLIEQGARRLSCGKQEYDLRAGHVLLFPPGLPHACTQSDEGTLDYRALNLARPILLDWAEEITGKRELPGFSQTVLWDEEAACAFRSLHEWVMNGSDALGKEESLLLLLTLLIERYGQPFAQNTPACREEVQRACDFLNMHFAQRILLKDICRVAGLSKSALLRAFAREKGVTPYRYLETVRIGAAKRLLEQGVVPAEAALRTGFSDQSHLTNAFRRFLGFGPGLYREIFCHKGETHGA